MNLYRIPSLSSKKFTSDPTPLWFVRALLGRQTGLPVEAAPALSFDPLKPNQAVLFSGVGGAGVTYAMEGLRQTHLEGRGAVLEFGFEGIGGDRLLKESLDSVSHRSPPVIVEPSLSPLKYESTILSAIQQRACLYWQMPYGRTPIPGALIKAFQVLLATQPSQHGRLLLILDALGFWDFDELERIVSLARGIGASVWVTTCSLTYYEQDLSRLEALFDSFFIFRQDGLAGGELAIKLCESVANKSIDVRANLTAQELVITSPGRFVSVGRNHLEFGQRPLPRRA